MREEDSRAPQEASLWSRFVNHPMLRGFMLFAIFRAFYGVGILVVTWFLASEADAPLWVSIGFLLCSMVFSRVLFRFIKGRGKTPDSESGPEAQTLG